MVNRNNRIILLAIFCAIIIVSAIFCHDEAHLLTADFSDKTTNTAAPELTNSTEYVQELPILIGNANSIGFHFANYSNRENSGSVHIRIYSGKNLLGSNDFDAAVIGDGEYLNVRLNKSPIVGEMLDIHITSDSKAGKAVTVWETDNKILSMQGASLTINGEKLSKNLNCSFGYQDPKLSYWFWVIFCFSFFALFIFGLPQYYYSVAKKSARARTFFLYLALLLIGTLVFSLRDLQFIGTQIIYGEDGSFLSRQLTHGLLPTLFTTRLLGSSADFSNTGVYLLIWLATKTAMLFDGYNLSNYPFWAGIYANMYLAFTAVVAYRAFELLQNKKLGVAAYLIVLLMPLGSSACEVLGRPLNTSFMWVATVAFLLMIQYIRDYPMCFASLFIGFFCFIGAFTFPICFLEIGAYLLLELIRAIKQRTLKKAVLGNVILIITFLIGIYMLPKLLTSEGLGAIFKYKPESLIEFVLARHFLYPFVTVGYRLLNNKLTLFLFAGYLVIVVAAFVIKAKEGRGVFNSYTLFAIIVFGVCFTSAFMRRTLTALFSNYSWSYPDRYFYACNVLAMSFLLYAISVLLEKLKLLKTMTVVATLFIMLLALSPHLFYFAENNYDLIIGSGYFGNFAESCAIAVYEDDSYGDGIKVQGYPNSKIPWRFPLPSGYVLITAEAIKK